MRRVQTALESKASGARPRDGRNVKRGLSLVGAGGASSSEPSSGPYGDLMRELRSSSDPSRMSGLFLALGQNAALVSRHHECFGDLLELLFLYDWSFGDAVSAAFETILHGLVSSNAGFLQPVFQLLVQNFFPLGSGDSDSEDESESSSASSSLSRQGESDSEEEDGAESASSAVARARASRVHGAIRSVLRIIPLGAAQLLPEIMAQFPPPGERVERQVCFLREALRVCGYVPVLRDRIVALVVERLVAMDADLRIDDLVVQPAGTEAAAATAAAAAAGGVGASLAAANGKASQVLSQAGGEGATFMMMVEEDEDGVPATAGGEAARTPEALLKAEADSKRLRALAEKLDRLLEALLDFCDEQLQEGPPRVHLLFFRLMLNIFDRLVLPQTGAKFVPFLMLYICRKRADFVDQFVERLLQRALNADGDTPVVLQLSAASYLASFLARGLYIGADSTLSALQHLTRWLHRYVADLERRLALGAAPPRLPLHQHQHHQHQNQQQSMLDPVEHLQFFAVSRAAVYVVMYKGEDVRAKELRVMDWASVVGCRLHPFSHFSGDVADEFARFALDNRLLSDVQCKALRQEALRWDEKEEFEEEEQASGRGGRNRQRVAPSHVSRKLADHYPFDPCLLRRTSRRVEPFYQCWLSKDGDEHAREYEQCNTAIEQMLSAERQREPRRPPRVEAAEAEEHEAQQEAERRLLLEGHGTLPPPIRIPGLSDRAMRVLSFLGAGDAPGSQASQAPGRTGAAGYHWGFAFGGPGSYPSSAGSMADASSPVSAAGLLRAGLVQSSSVVSDAMQNASMASSLSSTGSPVMFKPYTIPIKVNNPMCGPSVASDELSGSW